MTGDPLQDILISFGAFLLYVALGVVPTVASAYVIYFLLTIPLRRNERGRMFLDLVRLGLQSGLSPEQAVAGPAQSRDRTLGARFHLVAAYLEQGLTLSQALEKVPRLLPPQVQAMLKAGERIGDVGKVIPACRLLLRDSVSNVRSALNYLVLLAFLTTPFTTVVPLFIRLKVMPSFKAIFIDMMPGASLPAFTRFVFSTDSYFNLLLWLLLGFVWLATLAYIGGPRLRRWVDRLLPGVPDRLTYWLPWRRKRLHRDFSAMLALLLDADVPEAEAVRLAGDVTANCVMQRRAEKARSLLQSGVKLPEAIRVLDESRELRWRLANAFRVPHNFARSLAGWQESLDAKAFQLEQSAAQVLTTFLVLVNGFVVASVVVAMFLVLISLLYQATLW